MANSLTCIYGRWQIKSVLATLVSVSAQSFSGHLTHLFLPSEMGKKAMFEFYLEMLQWSCWVVWCHVNGVSTRAGFDMRAHAGQRWWGQKPLTPLSVHSTTSLSSVNLSVLVTWRQPCLPFLTRFFVHLVFLVNKFCNHALWKYHNNIAYLERVAGK